MHKVPTLQDIERFVRDFAGLGAGQSVTPQTRLDADLGITGDDGDDLLKAAAEHFGAKLADPIHGYRETFSLAENEYLFHAEGFDLLGVSVLVRAVSNKPKPRIRDLTLAELHDAIIRTSVNATLPNISLERTREG